MTENKMPDAVWAHEMSANALGRHGGWTETERSEYTSYTRTDLYQAVCAERDALRGLVEGMAGAKVTRYTLPDDVYSDGVRIEFCGFGRWAVRRGSRCLCKNGDWTYEPLPSGREDSFLEAHRFCSQQEALTAYQAYKERMDA